MQLRFLHVADIHLGYEQYNLPQRENDFARAYFAVADYATAEGVDFVLIAGDLFHKAHADALTMKQAIRGLEILKAARVPVVAIEGNHDTMHYRKQMSWMEFLCEQALLTLLNVQIADNGYKALVPFNEEERWGSWIDVAGARVYGIKYSGAATARILEEIESQIEPSPNGYTILALHAGMEGQVPNLHGGLTLGQIEPVRGLVDYLALGHVHKRLMLDDWIYNPGSTETNSMEEIDWPHGFFDVHVDTTRFPKHAVEAIETPSLRPFRRISVSAEGARSLDEFVGLVEETIASAKSIPEKAVVELQLGGVAEFRRQDLPIQELKSAAEARFSPLVVRVRNALVPPGVASAGSRERLSRPELERQEVERLVYQHAEYRDRSAAWAKLILDIKNLAIEKNVAPAFIVDHVRSALRELAGAEAEPPEDEALVVGSEVEGE